MIEMAINKMKERKILKGSKLNLREQYKEGLAVILLMKYTAQKGWTKSPTKRSDMARIVKLKTAPATRLHLFGLHQ